MDGVYLSVVRRIGVLPEEVSKVKVRRENFTSVRIVKL